MVLSRMILCKKEQSTVLYIYPASANLILNGYGYGRLRKNVLYI
jgi:hypothetical protein